MDGEVAEFTAAANAQHYEVPAAYFDLVLGPRKKYSCCRYDDASTTLAEAEERALAETCAHAGLADGQDILELGCGWGSLSLWMAEAYPNARITAVSNSQSQRAAIEAQARAHGWGNLRVITADMNGFAPDGKFDRVVSVAMLGVVGLAALAWLLADMAAAGIVSAEAAAGLRRLNALSAIALCGLLGWLAPRR